MASALTWQTLGAVRVDLPLLASTNSTTLTLVALLVILGVAMLCTTVWLVRATRSDPAALGPLEVMGDRSFTRRDADARAATLAAARPDGALDPAPMLDADLEPADDVDTDPDPEPVAAEANASDAVAAAAIDAIDSDAVDAADADVAPDDGPDSEIAADEIAAEPDTEPAESVVVGEPSGGHVEPPAEVSAGAAAAATVEPMELAPESC